MHKSDCVNVKEGRNPENNMETGFKGVVYGVKQLKLPQYGYKTNHGNHSNCSYKHHAHGCSKYLSPNRP